jgi:hypothetical protein
MAVVPADERDGRVAVGQVLAGDAHAPVGLGANGVDDLVVVALEVPVVEVDPEGDVPEQPHPGIGQDPLQHPGHRLDRLVVGGDPSRSSPNGVGKRSKMSTSTTRSGS